VEYELADIKGRVFYGQSQTEALKGLLWWLSDQDAVPIDVHVIEFDLSDDGEEMATVLYEQSP